MTSAIDPTKPTTVHAYTQEVRDNFSAAKEEIEELQGAQVTSGSGTGMVFSRSGTVQFPKDVGDGVTNLTTLITDYWTSLQGTGRTLIVDSGQYLMGSAYPTVSGFYIEAMPDTVFTSTLKTGGDVVLTGDGCGIEGGVFEHKYCAHVQITAASVSGNVCTCTAPGHLFSPGDEVDIWLLTGITGNGARTITAVNGNDFSFALTHADASATIPYHRIDCYNTDARAVYPVAMLSRGGTGVADDASNILLTACTNFHLRNIVLRQTRACNLFITSSSSGNIHNITYDQSASDGVHITGGSYNLNFTGEIKGRRSGDTCFAMIGYRANASPIRNINIQSLKVSDVMFHGAGLDISGVYGLSIRRFNAENIYQSGIRLLSDNSSFYTYGSQQIKIDHATLHTCGSSQNEPTEWERILQPAFLITGGGGTPATDGQLMWSDVEFGTLEIINPRWRAINGTGIARALKVGRFFGHGLQNGPVQIQGSKDWRWGSTLIEYTSDYAISLVGTASSGESIFNDTEFRHINIGAPLSIDTATCDGTTVTFVTKTAHGMSSTPSFITRGVRSTYTHATSTTATAGQNKDFALNANWMLLPSVWASGTNYAVGNKVIPTAGVGGGYYFEVIDDQGSAGSTEPTWPTADFACVQDGNITWLARTLTGVTTYTSIAFPDSTTIEITGSGLVATQNPAVYDIRAQLIPKARLYKGGGASNDCIITDGTVSRYPLWTFNRVRLTDQFLAVERLVDNVARNAIKVMDGADLTNRSGGLVGTANDAGFTGLAPLGGTRRHFGAFTGAPAGAVLDGDKIYFTPILIARGYLVTKLGFRVTTLESSKNARMGLYNIAGHIIVAAEERANVFDAANTDIEFPVYQYLPAGWYYIALIANVTGTAQIMYHTIDAETRARIWDSVLLSTTDLASPDFRITLSQAYGALPASFSGAARIAGTTTEPHLWVR